MRVKYPDIHDWGKRRQVLKLLSQTIGDDRVIAADNIYEVLTCVDASYAPQDDMIGHTDGCLTFGWGLIHANFSKQKLNTKISTDS